MREIKFRVWSRKEKRYVNDEVLIDATSGVPHIRMTIKNKQVLAFTTDYILEQFTGLKDKNGVEIYKGDNYKHGDSVLTIVWYEYGFYGYNKKKDEYSVLNKHHQKYYEVIGNIHDETSLNK